MVWGLFPVDSLGGAQKYYIFKEGTYKVGRKDCDIVVQRDTAMSRLHAEIVVDKMVSRDPSDDGSTSFPSHVRIVDRSKFGTFINKESGAKALRNQEGTIKDGDSLTFGTGNSTFRFCFVPIVVFIHSRKSARKNNWVQDTITSIGAYTIRDWSSECTHVTVDESSPVTRDLIEGVLTKKPILLSEWLKVLAAENIRTELLTYSSFLPTLSLEGTMVKLVEPKAREKCLEGYTFVLGSLDKYAFGNKFKFLLELVNAKLLHADEFCSSSQISTDGEDTIFVLVIPGESENEFNHISQLSSLSRVTDMKIVAAILSGHLDSSIIAAPSIVVSSSHSTDETIVADSDVEVDTVTSNLLAATDKSQDATKYEYKERGANESEPGNVKVDTLTSNLLAATDKSQDATKFEYKENDANESEHGNSARKYEENENNGDYSNIYLDKTRIPSAVDEEVVAVKRLDKGDESVANRHKNSDIIFSEDLIVRDRSIPAPARSTLKRVVDFKCFRKRETQSGNSFGNLIPFSKDPYRESDGGSKESAEYLREEKKRKQLEAIAEDLFNSEKGRKRASSSASIQALLGRR